MLGARRRVLGEEYPATLASAGNLAMFLVHQEKYADAERIEREVLGVSRRVLGVEHPATLASEGNLAAWLSHQGKHADAERIDREVLGMRRRVQGEEHPATLKCPIWPRPSRTKQSTPRRRKCTRLRKKRSGACSASTIPIRSVVHNS